MHRIVTRFRLIVIVAVLAAANIVAQQAPSNAGPHLQPNAGGEEAAVKRIVDGIMQPYLSQGQRDAGGRRWSRSSHLGAIVAVSLHGHRYFFPYAKATDAGVPFMRETPVEIGSCTKTFTNTLLALGINRNQIVADAPAQKDMPNGYTLRAQQLTPLELADFTSGMPDDPTNLPRGLERRSIEDYPVKDFLTWASNYEPRTQLPAPYKYSNTGIGLLSYWSRPRPAKPGKIRSIPRFSSRWAWPTRRCDPRRGGGELIEVNPEATPLSEFATQRIRESAAVALPKIVDQVITS